MGPFVHRFVITGREIRAMAASYKKGNVLFAINVLSDNFFDDDTDKEAYVWHAICNRSIALRKHTL